MAMIKLERRDDGVVIVWLDHDTKPVNTLSPAAVKEFEEKVAPLLDDDSVKALVVASAKPDRMKMIPNSDREKARRHDRFFVYLALCAP